MYIVKQGDVFLMSFPFTDLKTTKRRPVLILTNNKYNYSNDDVIVAAITSQNTKREYMVSLSQEDLEEGHLKTDSFIRIDKLYTISQSLLLKRFGSINPKKMDEVRQELSNIFLY